MIRKFSHIKIAGLNAAIPDNIVHIRDYINNSPKDVAFKVKRTAKLAGLEQRPVTLPQTTACDLANTAGRALLRKLNWSADSVNALFYATQTPDFTLPATAYLIHHKLGVSETCATTDIIASCSGLIQGIWAAAAHISPECSRILIFAGDTLSKTFIAEDIGNQILFGDGLGAIALEYSENENDTLAFNITSHPDINLDLTLAGSGVKASEMEDGFHMNGAKVLEFSHTKTTENVKALLEYLQMNMDDIEMFFSHQPNIALLRMLQEKLNIPKSRMPDILAKYGNCSSASIALLLIDHFTSNPMTQYKNALFCGFGGGFSVATMFAPISAQQCFPIIYHQE